MRNALSLLEVMIVLAVLGILGAVVFPQFQSPSNQAKEVAARNNLHLLRAAAELYWAQHHHAAPGYPNADTSADPSSAVFSAQILKASNEFGQYAEPGTPGFPLGPYLSDIPKNSFNRSKTVKTIGDNEDFPPAATGDFGWIYKPATREFRLDWPGTDKSGTGYYDY
jgi:prepilin-type N-terminal cleavage/methylation domain-containing protein